MHKYVFISFLFLTVNGYSHFLWVIADNYNPAIGEEVTLSIRFGHKFPEDADARASSLDSLFIINPDGKTIPLDIVSKGKKGIEPVKIRLNAKGTHLVVLTKKSGFVCKTTKGYFQKSKKKLESEGYSVLWSAWSEASAKAIINVEEARGESFKNGLNRRYQVIPLKNPGTLKKNETLPVKVVFKNKPTGKKPEFIYGTYSGFSKEKDTFCFSTKPGKDGMANIKMVEKGVWLIYSPEKMLYEKSKEAEEYSFTSTLTFELK
jgi:uncharacterized GH25 family protein